MACNHTNRTTEIYLHQECWPRCGDCARRLTFYGQPPVRPLPWGWPLEWYRRKRARHLLKPA